MLVCTGELLTSVGPWLVWMWEVNAAWCWTAYLAWDGAPCLSPWALRACRAAGRAQNWSSWLGGLAAWVAGPSILGSAEWRHHSLFGVSPGFGLSRIQLDPLGLVGRVPVVLGPPAIICVGCQQAPQATGGLRPVGNLCLGGKGGRVPVVTGSPAFSCVGANFLVLAWAWAWPCPT